MMETVVQVVGIMRDLSIIFTLGVLLAGGVFVERRRSPKD